MKQINFFRSTILLLFAFSFLTITAQNSHVYISPDKAFSIRFPAEPEVNSESVPTDIGDIQMYTVMYEESINKAYMVAYSDYPADLIDASDPMDLLYGAQSGGLSSLGITEPDEQEEITFDGYPGLFFEASHDGVDVVYKVLLVKNRLYQVAVLTTGDAVITDSDLTEFIDSFNLL